jgi:2-polyprenyl-3-methyl-5-hydroxy-6-metoxy-1,4-benzoquinol methylase
MAYADITFKDKNAIKRWLQRQRLVSALKLANRLTSGPSTPQTICDFGAGNGELCKHLRVAHPDAALTCYEPAPSLLAEARMNLRDIAGVEFHVDIKSVTKNSFDTVFCLEVFEHLPPKETDSALRDICALLRPNGVIVIGVPVEIGIPALYKGLYRMTQRYGEFDATADNVLKALVGRPPAVRPVREIAPGLQFHHEHLGFDFRKFQSKLGEYCTVQAVVTSPFQAFGAFLMPEIYFLAQAASTAKTAL